MIRVVDELNHVFVSFVDQASMIVNAVRPGEEEEEAEAKRKERKKERKRGKTLKKTEEQSSADQSKDEILEDERVNYDTCLHLLFLLKMQTCTCICLYHESRSPFNAALKPII